MDKVYSISGILFVGVLIGIMLEAYTKNRIEENRTTY